MIIIIIILSVIILSLLLYFIINKKNIENKLKIHYLNKHKEELNQSIELLKKDNEIKVEKIISENQNQINDIYTKYEAEKTIILENIEKEKQLLKEKQELLVEFTEREAENYKKQIEESRKTFETYLSQEREKCQIEIESMRTLQKTKLENDLKNEEEKAKAALTAELEKFTSRANEEKELINSEILQLKAIIDDYKKKQQVINEEILRKRKVEEKLDFYRIIIPESSLWDIEILNSVKPKLKNHDNLDKLIYDVYIAKPAQEMIKRVLQSGKQGGIYKITRISTGEIYIGRAATFSERWTQHIKSAYNIGTIADSLLHRKMREDGITNYTFEVLEIVPTEKQNEREKYWIEFYDSKAYGLNQRLG